jgi:hypothetical protein
LTAETKNISVYGELKRATLRPDISSKLCSTASSCGRQRFGCRVLVVHETFWLFYLDSGKVYIYRFVFDNYRIEIDKRET